MPYSIITKDGIKLNNIPDDVPRDSQVLKDRVAAIRAERQGTQQASPTFVPPAGDVPVMGQAPMQEPSPVSQLETLDYLKAVPEVALTLGGGATAGTLGGVGGALYGVGRSVAEGTYGTQAGALEAQQEFLRGMERFTPATTSPAGQKVLSGISGLVEPLAAVNPYVSAELQAAAQASRVAKTLKQEATFRPSQQAAESAAAANIPVYYGDIQPATTRLGKFAEEVAANIPIVGTGKNRAFQAEQRVEKVRTFLEDAGINELKDAPKEVFDDLMKTRGARIDKYVNEKNRIIADLSKPTEQVIPPPRVQYDPALGVNRSIQDAPRMEAKKVPMVRTNQYIDEQIARLSNTPSENSNRLISELSQIKSEINNNSLESVELNRKRLGERFKAGGMENIRTEGQSIISNIYKPLLDDMGSFIENNAGKEASQSWKKARAILKEDIDEVKEQGLNALIKRGKADPLVIQDIIIGENNPKNRRMSKMIYRNLSSEGKKELDNLFISNAYKASVPDPNAPIAGQLPDPDKFMKFIRSKSHALEAMSPETKRELMGIGRALDITKRSVTQKPKGISLANQVPLIGVTVGSLFQSIEGAATAIAASGAFGLGARAYESPLRVRRAYSKLGRTPKGSAAEEAAILGLYSAITEEQKREAKRRQQMAQ